MAPMYGYSGVASADDGSSCCVDDITAFPDADAVNNKFVDSSSTSLLPLQRPQIKSRRDRSSQQHSVRRQRSATTSLLNTKRESLEVQKNGGGLTVRSARSSFPGCETTSEEKHLTKMAFEDQQKWITVQQKTFTKWYARLIDTLPLQLSDVRADRRCW